LILKGTTGKLLADTLKKRRRWAYPSVRRMMDRIIN